MTDRNSGEYKEDELDSDENRFLLKLLPPEIRKRVLKVYFIVIKLPLILFAIVAGFIFEFIIELPFIALIFLDYRSKKKGEGRL
ncbi:MAG: hypothetical protein JRI61_08320 [Deltaproteobacteria bacterium]|nr:hypothetical protein [Deltaproteobacteria bacterium]